MHGLSSNIRCEDYKRKLKRQRKKYREKAKKKRTMTPREVDIFLTKLYLSL